MLHTLKETLILTLTHTFCDLLIGLKRTTDSLKHFKAYFPSYFPWFSLSFNPFYRLFSSYCLPLTAGSVLLTQISFTGSCNPATCYRSWGVSVFSTWRNEGQSQAYSFPLTCFSKPAFFNPLFHFILLAENKRRICLSCLWADLLPCCVVAQLQLAICCCIALALKHPELYS